jgi:hypothetical protein
MKAYVRFPRGTAVSKKLLDSGDINDDNRKPLCPLSDLRRKAQRTDTKLAHLVQFVEARLRTGVLHGR